MPCKMESFPNYKRDIMISGNKKAALLLLALIICAGLVFAVEEKRQEIRIIPVQENKIEPSPLFNWGFRIPD